MVPLIVMAAGILISVALGRLGIEWFSSWPTCVRAGLALMFLFTAVAHFNKMRPDLVRMVPPSFPNPELLVTGTGLAELAGAVGLLIPAAAQWAAYGLIAMLVAMFPANVYAARRQLTLGGRPVTPLALRIPLQILWIGLLWWSVE